MRALTGTNSLASCAMLFRKQKAPPCKNPCLNNGICEYLEATKRSRCVCPITHCGEKCQLRNTCKNGGSCTYKSTKNTARCLCNPHFTGAQCEVETIETVETSAGNATVAAKKVWTTPVIALVGVGILSIIAIVIMVAQTIYATTSAATPHAA